MTQIKSSSTKNTIPQDQPRTNFMGDVQPFHQTLSTLELMMCSSATLIWILFFTVGLVLPAQKFMQAFWGEALPGTFAMVGYLLLTLISYSMTNIAFLVCAASVLGCMAHRWQMSDELKQIPQDARLAPSLRVYFAAVLRGFFIYLLVLGGFVVVSSVQVIASITMDQYVRLAGIVSILGFVVGYDPNLLVRIMQRVIEAMPNQEPSLPQRLGENGVADELGLAAVEGVDKQPYPIGQTEAAMEQKERRIEESFN